MHHFTKRNLNRKFRLIGGRGRKDRGEARKTIPKTLDDQSGNGRVKMERFPRSEGKKSRVWTETRVVTLWENDWALEEVGGSMRHHGDKSRQRSGTVNRGRRYYGGTSTRP